MDIRALFAGQLPRGGEDSYVSAWGAYWLGDNYPARFTLFGAVLAALSRQVGGGGSFAKFQRGTQSAGPPFSLCEPVGDVDFRQLRRSEFMVPRAPDRAFSLSGPFRRGGRRFPVAGNQARRRHAPRLWAVFPRDKHLHVFFRDPLGRHGQGAFFQILGGSLSSSAQRIWNIKKYRNLPKGNDTDCRKRQHKNRPP